MDENLNTISLDFFENNDLQRSNPAESEDFLMIDFSSQDMEYSRIYARENIMEESFENKSGDYHN